MIHEAHSKYFESMPEVVVFLWESHSREVNFRFVFLFLSCSNSHVPLNGQNNIHVFVERRENWV